MSQSRQHSLPPHSLRRRRNRSIPTIRTPLGPQTFTSYRNRTFGRIRSRPFRRRYTSRCRTHRTSNSSRREASKQFPRNYFGRIHRHPFPLHCFRSYRMGSTRTRLFRLPHRRYRPMKTFGRRSSRHPSSVSVSFIGLKEMSLFRNHLYQAKTCGKIPRPWQSPFGNLTYLPMQREYHAQSFHRRRWAHTTFRFSGAGEGK